MRLLNGESRRSNARAPRAQRRRLLGQSGDDDGAKLDCARLHEVEVWKFGGWSTIIYMVEKDERPKILAASTLVMTVKPCDFGSAFGFLFFLSLYRLHRSHCIRFGILEFC